MVDQGLRLIEIEGVETLGEPAIDGRKHLVTLLTPALIAPQADEARRGPQFERLSLLPLRDGKGFSIDGAWDLWPSRESGGA